MEAAIAAANLERKQQGKTCWFCKLPCIARRGKSAKVHGGNNYSPSDFTDKGHETRCVAIA